MTDKERGGIKMTNKAGIEDARETVINFLKKTLGVKEVKIIKVAKAGSGWDTEAEVYEESAFIKSIGLPTRVKDRNFYLVKLNENLEVESYELEEEQLKSIE